MNWICSYFECEFVGKKRSSTLENYLFFGFFFGKMDIQDSQ